MTGHETRIRAAVRDQQLREHNRVEHSKGIRRHKVKVRVCRMPGPIDAFDLAHNKYSPSHLLGFGIPNCHEVAGFPMFNAQ